MNTKTLQDMVRELVDELTQTEISEGAQVTQPTVSRVLAGRGVNYENGRKLEAFYRTRRAQSAHGEAA